MSYRAELFDMLSLALSALPNSNLQLWGCEWLPQGKQSILRVYIDSAQGITLADCERASGQISAVLDVEDPIKTQYHLQISSPGIDRPLFILAHYQQYIGYEVKLRLYSPLHEQRNWRGILHHVNEHSIELKVDDTLVEINFNNIAKGNIVDSGK